nr:hypothetical protein [Candidatus Neomarinimicrobiota bacterium]
IYGGMQDNHSWMGPSATRHWRGILADDWKQIGFGDGMYQQPVPNSSILYNASQNGNIIRVDRITGNMVGLKPISSNPEEKYRFDWVTPLAISKYNSQKIFLGGNRLFMSKNGGDSWEHTKDLSTNTNRDSLKIMDIFGADIKISKNDGTSSYGEIVTISESPLWHRVIWVGTDDGNLQVSKDNGKHWREVSQNIFGLPSGSYVSRVLASYRSRGSAYATFDRHREGDWTPYVFRTDDFGKTWIRLTKGLLSGSVNVIVEHPDNPDVLFLGTEHALFTSVNAGEKWVQFKSNLPTTLYDDIIIHPREKDLVIGTHGRSIWILDDITPLAEWGDAKGKNIHIFSVRPVSLFYYWKDTSYRSQEEWAGKNPPYGAIINFVVNTNADSVIINIKRRKNIIIRSYKKAVTKGIINRFVWDMKHPPPSYKKTKKEIEGLVKPESEDILPIPPHNLDPEGPFVSPGIYTVTITTVTDSSSQNIRINPDPKLNLRLGDYRQQEKFLLDVFDIYENAFTLNEELKMQIKELEKVLDSEDEKLTKIKERQKKAKKIQSNLMRLTGELQGSGVRQGSFSPPTRIHRAKYARIEKTLQEMFIQSLMENN